VIEEYLGLAGHAADTTGPVFRPVTNNRTGDLDRPLDPPRSIKILCGNMVSRPALAPKLSLCVHSLRATAATKGGLHRSVLRSDWLKWS
jgi:integrase/recombinase XerD